MSPESPLFSSPPHEDAEQINMGEVIDRVLKLAQAGFVDERGMFERPSVSEEDIIEGIAQTLRSVPDSIDTPSLIDLLDPDAHHSITKLLPALAKSRLERGLSKYVEAHQ